MTQPRALTPDEENTMTLWIVGAGGITVQEKLDQIITNFVAGCAKDLGISVDQQVAAKLANVTSDDKAQLLALMDTLPSIVANKNKDKDKNK